MDLFLDSDGVLFDFDGHVTSHRAGDISPLSDPDLWALVSGIADFWYAIPLLPHALSLHEALSHLEPVVLTGCPRQDYDLAAEHKRRKFARHFPGVPVLTCPSRYKPIAAGVHMGLLDPDLLGLARQVFLRELSEPSLSEATHELRQVLAELDLKGAVLIDDMPQNCKRWAQCGGNAILFRSAPQALRDFAAKRFFQVRT